MEYTVLVDFVYNNSIIIVGVLAVLLLLAYILIFNLMYKIGYMKKRYKKMMTGTDGANIERLLAGCLDSNRGIVEENAKLWEENKAIKELLSNALTRVSVVRFRAFEDMGSDLSYAVALLDTHNNGVVFSSIFARDDSRTYAKPVVAGQSSYTMTEEEQQALQEAMAK